MKKAGLILLMVAFATLFTVGSVFADGVVDTPHDITVLGVSLQTQGTCSACHIPHKATGDRLWAAPQTSVGVGLNKGVVGVLCSSCHVSDGAYRNNVPQAAAAEQYVYTGSAHGVAINGYVLVPYTGGIDDVDLAAAILPYTTATDPVDNGGANTIQCTTCHNVHDNNANVPFLRVNIRDLCVQCHLDRGHSDGNWLGAGGEITAWDGGLGLLNLGSHPVGTNITGEMSAGAADSPIIDFTSTWMQLFVNAAGLSDLSGNARFPDGGGWWNLGKHTATSAGVRPGTGIDGGVVCVSCHAIHGVQDDSDPGTDQIQADGYGGLIWDYNPNTNLLARPQSQGGSHTGPSAANGAASDLILDGSNGLCEACHIGGAVPGTWSLKNNTDGLDYTIVNPIVLPNPGATDYTHPIDDAQVVASSLLVTDYGSTPGLHWPSQDAADPGAVPICESCHVPHPARAFRSVRNDVQAGAGQFILRAPAATICGFCHTTTLANHHPVGEMTNVVAGLLTTTYWTSTEEGADNYIGDGNVAAINAQTLQCGDCHNGSGAHNWNGPNQVGLDPDWLPVDNGRAVGDTRVLELANSLGQSATCELCHYSLRTGSVVATDVGTPTHDTADDWGTADHAPGGDFDKHGTGTHFLGAVNTGSGAEVLWTDGLLLSGTFDATLETWTNTNVSGGGWSRWGTTATGIELVCESCHELEPDKNEPGSKLLLYYFAENSDNTNRAGDNLGTSFFCEGCHSIDGPEGTHAMTGNTVSRTNETLRTTNALGFDLLQSVPGTGTPNLTPPGEPGTSTFPGADLMSCDSCHQVHDANSNSRTYILDAPEVNVGSGGDATDHVRGGAVFAPALPHPLGNTVGPDGAPDLDYTGFCDQCHWYTYNLQP